jgi:hypothetical protein
MAGIWPSRDHPVCEHRGEACELINRWFREGVAAGNQGDRYDNRDHGHATLNPDNYEQLDFITYPDTAGRSSGWGAPRELLPGVVLGNSSTAAPPHKGGCNARLAYVNRPQGIDFLHTQYRGNNLYVYPEHRDHDPGHNGDGGYGDLLPVNTPYMILSQGSSGTDLPFLRALFHTLAAFRPEVKRRLVDEGTLMPTVQMIFRWSNSNVQSDARYLTGTAHPTVFRREHLDAERMVHIAQQMTLQNLPPVVQLDVIEEDTAIRGRDFFEPLGAVENLADTPAVIARVHRDRAWAKRLTVSARGSRDAGGRALRYHWVVLRGDESRIEIHPSEDGAEATITVPYHERRPIAPGDPMESNRVDIGVFVHNGVNFSAPGFITFHTLDNEERTYDSSRRILEVNYSAGAGDIRLADASAMPDFWEGLIRAISGGPGGGLGRTLLAQHLDAREWALLEAVATRSAEIPAQVRQLEKEQGWAKSSDRQMRDALEASKDDVIDARAAHQTLNSSESKAALDTALANEQQWTAIQEETGEELRRLGKAITALREELNETLRTRDRMLEIAPRELLIRALDDIKSDVSFYPRNVADIHALSPELGEDAGSEETRRLLAALIDDGIFVRTERDHAELNPSRIAAGLASFELDQIQLFNVALLRHVVFPGLLKPEQGPNYVDPRLTATKTWRDTYAYDETGKLQGWTRYSRSEGSLRSKREAYSAEGWLITARDEQGRITAAQRVEYQRDRHGVLRVVPVGP